MRRCKNPTAKPQVASADSSVELPPDDPQEWLPPADAPYGTVIQVTDGVTRALAIRDMAVGWYDQHRAGSLPFQPTGWAPIC